MGSKETVLVFRTAVLAAHSFEPAHYSDIKHDLNVQIESCSGSSLSLPKTINIQRPALDNFGCSGGGGAPSGVKKKRPLELSPSSSSLSKSSSCSVESVDVPDAVKGGGGATDLGEDKENLVIEPIERSEMPGAVFNICYKFMNTETRLLRKILSAHGLIEVGSDCHDFNLLWTGIHLKPDILRNLSAYQRVNHFPRYNLNISGIEDMTKLCNCFSQQVL